MDGAGGVSTGRGEMMNRVAAQGRSLIISFTDRAHDVHSVTVQRSQNVNHVPSL